MNFDHGDDPFRPPASDVADPLDRIQELELASRSVRLGAALIDGVIQLSLFALMFHLSGYSQRALAGRVSAVEEIFWIFAGFLLFVAIHIFPLHRSGQTWGKRLLRIRVVDLAGNKPGLWRLLGLRFAPFHFVLAISFVGPWIALGDILLIFGRDRRCLHDLAAGTRVVKA